MSNFQISKTDAQKFAVEITETILRKSLFYSSIDIYRSYDAEQIGNFVKKLAENLYDNSISYETIKLLKAIFESDINKNKISVGFVDNYFSDFCEFINTLDKNFQNFNKKSAIFIITFEIPFNSESLAFLDLWYNSCNCFSISLSTLKCIKTFTFLISSV